MLRFGSMYGLVAALLLASAGDAPAAPTGVTSNSSWWANLDGGYYTYHFDNDRTGWNPTETTLSAAAVQSARFGRLRTLPTDGVVYAQPLYVPHLATPSGTHNVVVIATEYDSVYAYDADTGNLAWKRSFIDPVHGITAVSLDAVAGCSVITPTIGISSTPVIDPVTKTVYVVDKIQATAGAQTTYHNRLHAISLATGRDLLAPTEIGGTITLADGTTQPFFAQHQQNRPGLTLANGNVYVAFGSSCDAVPGAVHGWLFAYNATSLAPRAVFNSTRSSANAYLGSIWQSTYAPSVDAGGNVYVATGNGTFDPTPGRQSYSESILRLDPSLNVTDSFTPRNAATLTTYDQDVSSAGVMLIPDRDTGSYRLAVGGEKDGLMYLLDRDHLGGFDPAANHVLQTTAIEPAQNSLYGGPAYYNGIVYWGATNQQMMSFALTSTAGGPRLTLNSKTLNVFPGEGGEIPAVSSNGLRPGSAVVWATTRVPMGEPFQLFAYDATDLHKMLFSGIVGVWLSNGDAFLTPTIAGGHVFVPGAGTGVAEFGLK